MQKTLFGLCLLFICLQSVKSQEADTSSIENLFLEQLSLYPQEKIYVQTDRNTYLSGETIWFRAHLVDALLLKQANASRYVYTELINSYSDIVQRVKIRPDSAGCFHGHIRLEEELTEGWYTLRAYTRFMQNQGEDYFFRKAVYVSNPALEKTHSTPQQQNAEETFAVSFFPEGGHPPLSTDVMMAFKAVNSRGLSEDIQGQIYDDQGNVCAGFESFHLGMGSFRMYYSPGRKYHAICTNKENVSKRFDLPGASGDVVSLKTAWYNDRLRVTLIQSPDYALPAQIQLIAHIRGAVIYAQPWDEKQGYILFERDFLPAGIVHFLLIDKDRNILSERLVFSSQGSTFAETTVNLDREIYRSRDRISMNIRVTDESQSPLTGNFSLSVVNKLDVDVDTTSTIISTLLLSSELKGYIESPMTYLYKDNKKSALALDVLMMTQGWRRYDIPNILKGKLTRTLQYPVESSEEISGKAEGIFSALKDGTISLLAVKDSVIGTSFAKPDKTGRFTFQNPEYPDSTQFIIQALTKKDSKRVFLEMEPLPSFPRLTLPIITVDRPHINEEYLSKMDRKYTIENGMRLINLAEVEITAKRKVRSKTESPYYSVNSTQVLTAEDVETWKLLSVFDLLRRLPGITIYGDEVRYRGGTPMLLMDNVPVENFDYSMLDVNDINDAFVSPPVSVMPIFGARASGGAIVINTKKGFVPKNKINTNIQVVRPVGYQQTVAFYSPVYETEAEKNNATPDLRSTIYWNPNVQTDTAGNATLSFYAADSPAQYSVVMEGVSAQGHIVRSSEKVILIE
jgi:hypothetical protein